MKLEVKFLRVTDLVTINIMKRNHKITLVIAISIIIISNSPPITYFFQEQYHYQNKDGSFEFVEQAGPTQNFEVAKASFKSFKNENLQHKNDLLFRTFTFKPWRFWEWRQMLVDYDKYELPLLNNADAEN